MLTWEEVLAPERDLRLSLASMILSPKRREKSGYSG
jgi:hypothetical protein